MNRRWRTWQLGKKQEAAEILDRIVALEPSRRIACEWRNWLRNWARGSWLRRRFRGLRKPCGGGRRSGPVVRKAYQEDSSNPEIALAYGQSLLAQGQVGAAIFILEHNRMREWPPEFRETYADALVAAGRFTEAEPLVWQLFEAESGRVQQVIGLIGSLLDGKDEMRRSRSTEAGAISAAPGRAQTVHRDHGRHHERRGALACADAGISERTI